MPPPAPAEKHLPELIEAQAKRIESLAREIEKQRLEVNGLHEQKRVADQKADESTLKYAQLKLEAYLGLWKVVIVAIAVVIVACLIAALLWFRHKDLAELVKAARPEKPAQIASAPAAAGGSASAVASSAPGDASAPASVSKNVAPGSPR